MNNDLKGIKKFIFKYKNNLTNDKEGKNLHVIKEIDETKIFTVGGYSKVFFIIK